MEKKILVFILILAVLATIMNADAYVRKQKQKTHKTSKVAEPSKTKEIKESDHSIGTVIGTFDITTNYIFRGITQSFNIPAVQGGFTYKFKKGFYGDIWGSNVFFPIADSERTATFEFDTGLGFANSINDNTSFNLHFVRYNYPKATKIEYNEFIGSLTYRFITALIGYSNNVFNSDANGTYYNLALNFELPSRFIHFENVSLNAAMGYYELDKVAGHSYSDYSILLNKVIDKYTLTLQWIGTNHRFTNNTLDSNRIVGTVTAAF